MAAHNGGNDKSSAGRESGKFIQGFPRDNSSFKVSDPKGKSGMGGSASNLSHSLPGASANQKGPR
jgi:hypothetical protein